MKKMCGEIFQRRGRALLLLLVLCVFLKGTEGWAESSSAKRVRMTVGQSRVLLREADAWSSEDPAIVLVDQNGRVTGRSEGEALVTAYVGRAEYRYRVLVELPRLSVSARALSSGESFSLSLHGTHLKFRWSVSDPSVLSIRKKKKNCYQVKALAPGKAQVIVSRNGAELTCSVTVSEDGESSIVLPESAHTLYLDNNVFKELTWKISDTANYVSSVSHFGQSARLYTHKDGGDGLENIWSAKNNGAVGVPGAQLSAQAVKGTIQKAVRWAWAVCDSPYHGYDYGHGYKNAVWGYAFGQAKATGLGTGDYSCSTIPLCAYYFAGVNVIGENLGGENARYIPDSTRLFYRGEISFLENGKTESLLFYSNYEWQILKAAGFEDVYDSYRKDPEHFVFRAGDVVTANGHAQLVLTDGSRNSAMTAQAYGPDVHGRIPRGGDQKGNELERAGRVRTSPKIRHIMRFTGKGVRLNTVGLK